jgi:hypothetical protein
LADELSDLLTSLYPGSAATVLLLEGATDGLDPRPGSPSDARQRMTAGGLKALDQRLPSLLRSAAKLDARLCALVTAGSAGRKADWLRLLLSPILDEGYDYVCPSYVRGRYQGAINTAIIYPLLRALFGRRLRQPLGAELALSRKLVEKLAADEEWTTDSIHAGTDAWLVSKLLGSDARICQSFLGRMSLPTAGSSSDLSEVLAQTIGPVFGEMERRPAVWQRISGSEPVPTFGEEEIAAQHPPGDVAREVAAFVLGCANLHDLWGAVLPPASLLALKQAARQGPPSFRLDADLWARIVYDFAVGYHVRAISRAQLLRSMTPLYLGWVASFINQVRALDARGVEEAVEQSCRAFEMQKPYLISRWRWPDRFSP